MFGSCKVTNLGIMARVLGGLMFVFFMTFIVGEGLLGGPGNNIFGANATEAVMLALMLAAVVGLAVGFWREFTGGLITVVCMLAWLGVEVFGGDKIHVPDADLMPFYLVLVAGVLFLVAGIKRKLPDAQSDA